MPESDSGPSPPCMLNEVNRPAVVWVDRAVDGARPWGLASRQPPCAHEGRGDGPAREWWSLRASGRAAEVDLETRV